MRQRVEQIRFDLVVPARRLVGMNADDEAIVETFHRGHIVHHLVEMRPWHFAPYIDHARHTSVDEQRSYKVGEGFVSAIFEILGRVGVKGGEEVTVCIDELFLKFILTLSQLS